MENQVFVLFDESSKVLIPINQGIFFVSQFKSAKKLNKLYSGSWILFPDGAVKSIKRIDITGYHGDTFWKKLFGVLNSTHNIAVELEVVHPKLDVLLDKAINYLRNDLSSVDPYMQRQEFSKLDSDKIKSSAQLYSALSLPAVEDCLDVL